MPSGQYFLTYNHLHIFCTTFYKCSSARGLWICCMRGNVLRVRPFLWQTSKWHSELIPVTDYEESSRWTVSKSKAPQFISRTQIHYTLLWMANRQMKTPTEILFRRFKDHKHWIALLLNDVFHSNISHTLNSTEGHSMVVSDGTPDTRTLSL